MNQFNEHLENFHADNWQIETNVSDSEASWYNFSANCEKLLGHDLDGTQWECGYCIDMAYDAWKEGKTAQQHVKDIKANPLYKGEWLAKP